MCKFSISNDHGADGAFEDILNELLDLFFSIVDKTKIKALILTGGFGRGEGGIFKDGTNYSFVNDIDFIVIPKINAKLIRKQIPVVLEVINKKGLLKKNGLKQIDFTVSSDLSLMFSPNLISYYEVREGSQIVYGNYDLKKVIKERKPENLSLIDGTRLFLNRGYGLLIAFYVLMKKLDSNKTFRENIVIELQKAIIAMGDALLLLNGQYHYSYLQRGKNFSSLINTKKFILREKTNIDDWATLYISSIEKKLKPTKELFRGDNYDNIFEISNIFLKFFMEYECLRLRKSFNNWIEYSNHILKKGIQDTGYLKVRRKLKEIKLIKNTDLDQKRMLAILPHLLLALNADYSLNSEYLNNIVTKLKDKKLFSVVMYNENILKYFLQTFHREGIISSMMTFDCKHESK